MSSNRQLLDAGFAKRADLVKIQIEHIHVEPGFNAPETAEEFERRVDGMVLHLQEGGSLPPIEVRDRPEGGVYVVDGHARRAAYERAHSIGVPVADPKDGKVRLLTLPFVGNDADRVARIITSAEGRTLTPLQLADLFKRLRAYGWSNADISRKVGKSGPYVGEILALGDANSDVQQMVKDGEVAASVAAKIVKRSRDNAGAVLRDHLATAKASGKKKVTAAVIDGPKRAQELSDADMFRWLIDNAVVYRDPGHFRIAFSVPAAMSATIDGLRSAIEAAREAA